MTTTTKQYDATPLKEMMTEADDALLQRWHKTFSDKVKFDSCLEEEFQNTFNNFFVKVVEKEQAKRATA